MSLKYYNPEIHKASFVLPEFARKVSWFQILIVCPTLGGAIHTMPRGIFCISPGVLSDRCSEKHDQQQRAMCILQPTLRTWINNLFRWLLELYIVKRHPKIFSSEKILIFLSRSCTLLCCLSVLHVIVLSAFCEANLTSFWNVVFVFNSVFCKTINYT